MHLHLGITHHLPIVLSVLLLPLLQCHARERPRDLPGEQEWYNCHVSANITGLNSDDATPVMNVEVDLIYGAVASQSWPWTGSWSTPGSSQYEFLTSDQLVYGMEATLYAPDSGSSAGVYQLQYGSWGPTNVTLQDQGTNQVMAEPPIFDCFVPAVPSSVPAV